MSFTNNAAGGISTTTESSSSKGGTSRRHTDDSTIEDELNNTYVQNLISGMDSQIFPIMDYSLYNYPKEEEVVELKEGEVEEYAL